MAAWTPPAAVRRTGPCGWRTSATSTSPRGRSAGRCATCAASGCRAGSTCGRWAAASTSATPNLRPWDASGAVGLTQRERLRDLLRQLPTGPRVLVTHYPVCVADGRPESRWHGLRDLAETVRVAADGGVGLWLHGHRHTPYF